jgi:hypothetical protein
MSRKELFTMKVKRALTIAISFDRSFMGESSQESNYIPAGAVERRG